MALSADRGGRTPAGRPPGTGQPPGARTVAPLTVRTQRPDEPPLTTAPTAGPAAATKPTTSAAGHPSGTHPPTTPETEPPFAKTPTAPQPLGNRQVDRTQRPNARRPRWSPPTFLQAGASCTRFPSRKGAGNRARRPLRRASSGAQKPTALPARPRVERASRVLAGHSKSLLMARLQVPAARKSPLGHAQHFPGHRRRGHIASSRGPGVRSRLCAQKLPNYVERDLKRFAGVERSTGWRRLSCQCRVTGSGRRRGPS